MKMVQEPKLNGPGEKALEVITFGNGARGLEVGTIGETATMLVAVGIGVLEEGPEVDTTG
jgi:hypothetical protein